MTKLVYNDDFDIEHHPITERVQAKADEIGALFNLPEAASGFYHKTSHGTILTFSLDWFNSEDSSLLKIAQLGVREFRIGDTGILCNFHFSHELTPDWEVSAQIEANKHTGEKQNAKQ